MKFIGRAIRGRREENQFRIPFEGDRSGVEFLAYVSIHFYFFMKSEMEETI